MTQVLRPDLATIEFGYDAAGRPATLTTPDGQRVYQYDAGTGQLASVSAPEATLGFAYDGALLTQVHWSGTVVGSITAAYDNSLRVSSTRINDSHEVAYGYDGDDLVTAAGPLAVTRHPQNGLFTRSTLQAIVTEWTRDGVGRVSGETTRADGEVVWARSYTRDLLGRITALTEAVQGATTEMGFTYDSTGRLVEVRTDGIVSATYEYDANGNRLRVTRQSGTIIASYDTQDRLVTSGDATYAFTLAGELATKTAGPSTTMYRYDLFGNLAEVRIPDGTVVTYVVDAFNRRIGRKVNGVLVQGFLYQGQLSPVAELNGANHVMSRFVYATRAHVPDFLIKNDVIYRILTDHLGSVRLVVNASNGDVAQRLDYDEFGRVVLNTNPGFQPFGFAGGLYDAVTGLVRFGARDYDAATGRWTAKDPIGFAGGNPNLYGYVLNDPVNLVDPSGLFSFWDVLDVGFFLKSLHDFIKCPSWGMFGDVLLDGIGLLPIVPSVGMLDEASGAVRKLADDANDARRAADKAGDAGRRLPHQLPADPTHSPGPGWEWRGNGPPGSSQGNWYNPQSRESLHPNLGHGEPIGAHWDYKDPDGNWWRVDPNTGGMTLKR